MTPIARTPAAPAAAPGAYAVRLQDVGRTDTPLVGGKNASLGELLRALVPLGVRVPPGFATTADAYRAFVAGQPAAGTIGPTLADLKAGRATLREAGERIRAAVLATPWPPAVEAAIRAAYRDLCKAEGLAEADVAVRSSATAEDLADASFAGQHDSFLHIRGEDAVLDACRRCFASLFNDRAIAYREAKGFDHAKVALCAGVQRMVRSDLACAGVMFSIDPESGFPNAVVLNAAWGAGESVVQGAVTPDQLMVFKPFLGQPGVTPILERTVGTKATKRVYAEAGELREVPVPPADQQRLCLTDAETLELAAWAVAVERHYGGPMDMEWAKDGPTGRLYMVQARPETVHARRGSRILRHTLLGKGERLVSGLAIGQAVATGRVARVDSPADIDKVPAGAILVTRMTDPDWVPVMRRVAGIVTDEGGRTCHAAIVSRELGVPSLVGTQDATRRLQAGQEVTLSCAEGTTGHVYAGILPFRTDEVDLGPPKPTRTKVHLIVASPDDALRAWPLPADGIGLARTEFLIASRIGLHPLAALHPERAPPEARAALERVGRGFASPAEGFVDALARGIAQLAASQHPRPVVVRTSDFKTNEYAALPGGAAFEGREENPMLGWRGCSRYVQPPYDEAFRMECRALRRARGELGMRNVEVLLPFCRTPAEADAVLRIMAEEGLRRGEDGLRILLMCEIPANVLRAPEFAARFDGFSIGSNDLTQLVLGVDRDSARLRDLFDERDPAVVHMLDAAIAQAHAARIPIGICGQAPADHPELARHLVRQGIDSIAVTQDRLLAMRQAVADAEAPPGPRAI